MLMPVLIIIGAILLAWTIYALIPTAIYKYFRDNSLHRFGISGKNIMLTFDDGPDPRYTPRLLEILAEYNIKAVFFLPGFKLGKYGELADRIVEAGHLMGMHGSIHKNPLFMLPLTAKNDIKKCCRIWRAKGLRTCLFRPPHGCINLTMLKYIKKYELTPVLWTVCARDWLSRGEEPVSAALKAGLKPGAVILLHDSGEATGGQPGAPEYTLQALEKFIPIALSRGYSFVTPNITEYIDEKTAE